MYELRFGLKRRPFPTTPDGSVYYPATGHEAILGRLQRRWRKMRVLPCSRGLRARGKLCLA